MEEQECADRGCAPDLGVQASIPPLRAQRLHDRDRLRDSADGFVLLIHQGDPLNPVPSGDEVEHGQLSIEAVIPLQQSTN
jgi:hypothetical protein